MKQQKKSFGVTKLLISGVIFIAALLVGKALLTNDFGAVMEWWLTLLILAAVFYPLSFLLFSRFRDGGWLFSKAIGVAVSGWLLWYLSSMEWLRFTRTNAIIIVTVCLVLNGVLMFFLIKKKKYEFSLERLSGAVSSEVLFFVLFIIWCFLRGFKPEAYGTEKFMDYGFMTAMMRAEYMPPQDLWLAGETINYYYLGQYFATYLTKLSGVTVNLGYNLMLMSIAALGYAMPYSIIANLTDMFLKDRYREKAEKYKAAVPAAGTVAGIAVSLSSNAQYPVYKWFLPHVRDLLGITAGMKEVGYTYPNYWFPNATRYIGYFPETTDKTIHEFPIYSFVLGDLHAHVVNIMFVLTVVAILLGFVQYRKKVTTPDLIKEAFSPAIIMIGFFIGLFHMTNYWDYPIYFVVSGAVILFSNLIKYEFKLKTLLLTAIQAAVILVISAIVCLPFTMSFDQISTSVKLCVDHTPLYQLIILWGIPVTTVIVFLVNRIRDIRSRGIFEEKKPCKLFKIIGGLSDADLFALVLGLCAIGLVLIPEVIYVEDIYTGDYKRANTMFKLTYQAFIMFGMAMGYILTKLLIFGEKKGQRIFAVIMLVLVGSTTAYFFEATDAWYGKEWSIERNKGLDCTQFIYDESESDAQLVDWLNENVEGTPVVLEANGASYTFYERVSALTGLPTVLGWRTHEWLWRSEASSDFPPELTERENDIKALYTATDPEIARSVINKYDISYIVVGKTENDAYKSDLANDLIRSLGTVVCEVPASGVTYDSYIVKVK